MFSKGPPGSRHFQTDDKTWQELQLRIDTFLDQQYAAVDRDNDSDEGGILEVERWDPWLERTEAQRARQAKDMRAPGSKVDSTGARKTPLVPPYNVTAGSDNGDVEFKSIWEIDLLGPSPGAGDAKKTMVADWAADQSLRRQRRRKCKSRSRDSDPDSDWALRNDDPRPLRHSRSLQEGYSSGLQHFGSSDMALYPDVARWDLDDPRGAEDGGDYDEYMDEDALPQSGIMEVALPSPNSGSPRGNTTCVIAPEALDWRISDG